MLTFELIYFTWTYMLHGATNVVNETLPVISGDIITINRFITPLADLQGHL